MAGRRPKPTAVKELAGNPGKRPLPAAEPRPARGVLAPPAHLTASARKEWQRLAAQLDLLGILTSIDHGAFAGYCEAFAVWCKAKGIVNRKGMTYEHKGIIRKRPEVSIASEAMRQMRHFAAEFGLTPSSRSRVADAMANQPKLPGLENLPEQSDPAKPTLPDGPWEFTDNDFFGAGGGGRPN